MATKDETITSDILKVTFLTQSFECGVKTFSKREGIKRHHSRRYIQQVKDKLVVFKIAPRVLYNSIGIMLSVL